jgi:hypothetical protein
MNTFHKHHKISVRFGYRCFDRVHFAEIDRHFETFVASAPTTIEEMRRTLEKSSGADLPWLTLSSARYMIEGLSRGARLRPMIPAMSEKILANIDLCKFEYVEEIPRSIETASQTDNGR